MDITVHHKLEFIYFDGKIIPVRRILLITKEEEVAPFAIYMQLDNSTNSSSSELFQTEEERDARFDDLRKLLTEI